MHSLATPRSSVFVVLALLACVSVGAQDVAEDRDVHREPSAGFAIRRPVSTWSFLPTRSDGRLRTLALGPPEAQGRVRVTITVTRAAPRDLDGLRQARDAFLERIREAEGLRGGAAVERRIAGRIAPGLRVEQEALGDTFHVVQYYLHESGIDYKLQLHAPTSRFAEYRRSFERALDGFEFIEREGPVDPEEAWRALAARCGSEVEWHTDWADVARRARREGKRILVAVHALPGFELDDRIASGPFMHPDVVELVRLRFVVLRWRRGMGAPFEDPSVFGLSGSTFGAGLLVVTPEGVVLRQVFQLDGESVHQMLLEALAEDRALAPPEPPQDASAVERFAFFVRSGQLERAETFWRGAEEMELAWEAAAWRAELFRRRRLGPETLVELERARALLREEASPDVAADLRLQLRAAVVHLLLGATATARAGVDEVLAHANAPAARDVLAEALWWDGALRWVADDRDGAVRSWERLVAEHPDLRWAWLAAATRLGPAFRAGVRPDPRWPTDAGLAAARLPEPASVRRPPIRLEDARDEAIAFLLGAQRADGAWPAPTARREGAGTADPFTVAATAIAARQLLRVEGLPVARDAASRALAWMLEQGERARKDPLPIAFMDYTVWSASYTIFFLADALAAGLEPKDRIRAELAHQVEALATRQQTNGGFSYYRSGSLEGEPVSQAISFTTATVVLALERASRAGIELPTGLLERGLDCLEALRSEAGTFGYFLFDLASRRTSGTDPAGAAGRGPVCALALLRGGRERPADLRRRFELYAQHLGGFGAERRKALMHAGAATQGSHYLTYDYATAAEALREVVQRTTGPDAARRDRLPRDLRRQVHDAIVRELRLCRNADGSFVDNPILGVHTATGLALSALHDLLAIESP